MIELTVSTNHGFPAKGVYHIFQDQLHGDGVHKTVHFEHESYLLFRGSLYRNNQSTEEFEFSNKGSDVEIDLSLKDEDVKVSIKDSGTGMSSDELDSLFSSSTGLSKRGTGGERGIGLGLTLCHEFMELHDESIRAEKGNTFHITHKKC